MIKKMGWPMFLVFVISLSFIFIVGFLISINISKSGQALIDGATPDKEDVISKPDLEDAAETSPNKKSVDKILIMGDSIGFGLGDNPDMGIGNRYIGLINPDGTRDIELINISTPGHESLDLVRQIEKQENLDLIRDSDLIVISIGGNDLNRLGDNDSINFQIDYREKLKTYKENLSSVIDTIREINQNVQLAIVGLYDPYRLDKPQNTRYLLEWNYETRLIVNSYSKVAYIPLYEKFENNLDLYLSADQFHPSENGYQLIAEELYEILNGISESEK